MLTELWKAMRTGQLIVLGLSLAKLSCSGKIIVEVI